MVVRARKASACDVVVQVVVDGILLAKVGPVLPEAEGEDVGLSMAPSEQGRQVGAEKERVGAREVDVPAALRTAAPHR